MPYGKPLSDRQIQEILKLYVDDSLSQSQIAELLQVTQACISATLRRHGVRGRSRGISNTHHAEIVRLYSEDKLSSNQIAKIYGVSGTAIRSILAAHSVPRRTSSQAAGGLKPESRADVAALYSEGVSIKDLAKRFTVSETQISNILREYSVSRRSRSECNSRIPASLHRKAVQLFEDGLGMRAISDLLDIKYSALYAILRRSCCDTSRDARMPFDSRLIPQLVKDYLDGERISHLSLRYGKSILTLQRVLDEAGVPRRSFREERGGLPIGLHAEICKRYLEGENSVRLAIAYKTTPSTICNILEENGIDRRNAPVFGDSVEHALACTGRFSQLVDTFFYVYEIAGFSGLFKPAITVDFDDRERKAKGVYGKRLYERPYSSRHHAYFIEQAVLKETKAFFDCPADLWQVDDWGGYTEIRNIEFPLLLQVIDYYESRMDELGLWEFAYNYVPMTAEQRLRCEALSNSLPA